MNLEIRRRFSLYRGPVVQLAKQAAAIIGFVAIMAVSFFIAAILCTLRSYR